MTYSLGEVEALSRKAARGAGLSWGMAEEAGKAVRWLCGWGLSGTETLTGYLDAEKERAGPIDPFATDWHAPSGTLCPLICGVALSDLGRDGRVERMSNLDWPLLLVPFVARIRQEATITWEGVRISWNGQLYAEGDLLSPSTTSVSISGLDQVIGAPLTQTWRADPGPDILARLTGFAARTYAPETEASKLSGAGAGLKDED